MDTSQRVALAAWLLAVTAPGTVRADGPEADECKEIHARIVDAQVIDGCASPFGFCAGGAVDGNGGLEGTTWFVMDGAVLAPATAPGYAAVTGILDYTTEHGTLTVRETGISNMPVDASRGHGAAVQDVIGGTGRFAGATGHLELTQGPSGDGHFVSEVTGVVCFPR